MFGVNLCLGLVLPTLVYLLAVGEAHSPTKRLYDDVFTDCKDKCCCY